MDSEPANWFEKKIGTLSQDHFLCIRGISAALGNRLCSGLAYIRVQEHESGAENHMHARAHTRAHTLVHAHGPGCRLGRGLLITPRRQAASACVPASHGAAGRAPHCGAALPVWPVRPFRLGHTIPPRQGGTVCFRCCPQHPKLAATSCRRFLSKGLNSKGTPC